MDRAYEGNETRRLAPEMGSSLVAPPLSTRIDPWEYDKEIHKRLSEIGRPFRRLKG